MIFFNPLILFRSTYITLAGTVVCWLLSFSIARAQNTCSQTLIKAQFTYYEGRAEEIPGMLDACLKDGFTSDEKLQAYRLLTLTYLYLNEVAKAEKVMLSFLQLNPVYRVNEAVDPAEFINLYKQFRTWPVYMAGGKAGVNSTYVNILQPYSLDNIHTTQPDYRSAFSYQLGAVFELPLKKAFSATAELFVSGRKFSYSNTFFGYEQLQLTEIQNRIDVPLLLNYTFPGKKFSPYLSGGVTSSLLIQSQAQVRRTDNITINEVQKEITGPNITLSPQRQLLSYSGTINLGVKYTRSRNIFIVESRYNLGLNNIVKKGTRYANRELIYKYGFIDNDLTINNFTLSVGYLIPVYKPRKLANRKDADTVSAY